MLSDFRMKTSLSLLLLTFTLLLSACAPHPGAGVWTTTEDNDYGISKLVIAFEGRAEFVTSKLDNAIWHCFWGATGKQEVSLDCKSSADPEQKDRYILTINDQGLAELRHQSQLVAIFTRQDENPSLEK